MKKTKAQIACMKDSGIRFPFFWDVMLDNDHFLHVRNWFTGENRIIRKG